MQIGSEMATLQEKNPKMDPKKHFFLKNPPGLWTFETSSSNLTSNRPFGLEPIYRDINFVLKRLPAQCVWRRLPESAWTRGQQNQTKPPFHTFWSGWLRGRLCERVSQYSCFHISQLRGIRNGILSPSRIAAGIESQFGEYGGNDA